MKHILTALFILALATLACNLPLSTPVPAPTASPPTETVRLSDHSDAPLPPTQSPVLDTPAPEFPGQPVTYDRLSLVLPAKLASGGTGQSFPRAEGENIGPWEITPGHIAVTFIGYTLPDTFHTARIYVFPAEEYAALFEGAEGSINRLRSIFAAPNAPVAAENLPFIPFFNAGAQFSAQIQRIEFQNGAGVRFLTQYGQDVSPINNRSMFYQFQGLTSDGNSYVIAILPVNHPALPADYDSPTPPGGIPFPDTSDPNADFMGYYEQVGQLLDTSTESTFTPNLETLDLLIQSIQVTP